MLVAMYFKNIFAQQQKTSIKNFDKYFQSLQDVINIFSVELFPNCSTDIVASSGIGTYKGDSYIFRT